jgi:hypothetical protein
MNLSITLERIMGHCIMFATIGFLFVPSARGHHSEAGLDTESLITIEGTITEYEWRNPHIYFGVETTSERGERVEWVVQTSPIASAMRRGWTSDSLAIGERVLVEAHPATDGRPYALLYSIEKEGGIVLGTAARPGSDYAPEPRVTASTSTLEGIWMANRAELVSYPGGFDGFFKAHLRLTAAGAAAQAAYDPLSDENPESRCIGRPTPAMIVSSDLFPMEIEINEDEEIIMIRSGFWDEERTVHMDGRAHPGPDERFPSGHSIGRWDGGTLIVDTTNFTDHRSPYQIGVPSGARKHVVERYRLNPEGTRIVLEFVLEDSQYLTEPLTHTRELLYSPHLEMPRYDCDPESTSRFLRQQR